MTEIRKYIGFDLGAESGRCVVGELEGNKLSLTEVHRFTTHNVSSCGQFNWDILAIYQELVKGLSLASERFGNHFDGISVDTWGVDYVLLDADNRLLGYPCHYRDHRTDGMIEKSFNIVPKEKLYQQTGIQFVQFNTLFQLLAERNQKLNLLEITDKILLIPDFLNFMLSGQKKAEYTIVSTTSLADPMKRDWCWKLIDAYKFPRNIFPEVVEPGYKLDTILPELAKRTGISQDTLVISGAGHDTAAAVVSVPAHSKDWAFLSSGTWSLMGMELPKPLINEQAMAYNFTNEGGVEGTIRFLKNIIGLWPIQECRRYWLARGREYNYVELAKLAMENGPAGAWINADDSRFLKPENMPEKITSYFRETYQKYKDEVGFIIRAILESLAFKYRSTIAEIEEVTGQKIGKLHAVGGGIQNEVLNQLTADALGCEVIAGPIEGTVIGNIGVQAITTGAVKNLQEFRKIVTNSFELKTYHPDKSSYFDEYEDSYKEILKINLFKKSVT
jgi:rhamnulokinase